ncbi:MAG: methyltransferase domain-containing protein [Acidobacteriia bacterium]|nr:methyltransferase domain-containing protein [Terriglobia bacterium]
MKRVVTPELLDSDAATPAEVQQTLADLRRINRWFGGISTTRRMLEQVVARLGKRSSAPTELTLLDVGAGSGDVSLSAARQIRPPAQIRVTLMDRMPAHLPRNGTGTVAGDALALPFLDGSFDLVTCSLLIHHLEREQIVHFVNQALRVARVAVLLNDLRREPLHLALMYAGYPLFARLTLHDGIASVRRAYTPQELKSILGNTQAAAVEMGNRYLYRMGIIVWKDVR